MTTTESQITALLEKTSANPRTLAIAYLRANARARAAELALKLHEDLNKALFAIENGDPKGCLDALNKSIRRMQTEKTHEKERK